MGSTPFGSGERRATRRYDLSLPIGVCVVPHKRSEPCHGRIQDISARGIYFITNEEFTPGAELEFIIAPRAVSVFQRLTWNGGAKPSPTYTKPYHQPHNYTPR